MHVVVLVVLVVLVVGTMQLQRCGTPCSARRNAINKRSFAVHSALQWLCTAALHRRHRSKLLLQSAPQKNMMCFAQKYSSVKTLLDSIALAMGAKIKDCDGRENRILTFLTHFDTV